MVRKPLLPAWSGEPPAGGARCNASQGRHRRDAELAASLAEPRKAVSQYSPARTLCATVGLLLFSSLPAEGEFCRHWPWSFGRIKNPHLHTSPRACILVSAHRFCIGKAALSNLSRKNNGFDSNFTSAFFHNVGITIIRLRTRTADRSGWTSETGQGPDHERNP